MNQALVVNNIPIQIELTFAKNPVKINENYKIPHHLDMPGNPSFKEIDLKFGEFIGLSINKFISENKLDIPDLISSHGHTVFHQPNIGKTLQIGNGKVINEITGIKTVNNFREQDVKLGGQGAPLVPIGDKLLFNEYRYCLNLGGFINISIKKEKNIYV